MYRYTFRNLPRLCIFSPFFHIFDTQFNSILHIHLKTISYSFCNLFSIQFLFQYLSLLQESIMNYSQITLIWVMTHTQTKYKDLLGFVLNPSSITCPCTMNPSSKRGFHMLLVLFKVLPSILLRILGLGRNPNKTLGLELINFSRIPYKIHMIHIQG